MGSNRTIQLSNLPVVQDSKGLVQQLEDITGKGTVYACKLRTPKSNKSRMHAHVQFESHESAEVVHFLANSGNVRLGLNKLTAQYLQRDIVSKPKSMPTRFEEGKLYMGNLISQNVFHFLWNSDNSAVAEFGFDIRKLSIILKDHYIDYKMELAFRDIRHIHLHNARGLKLLLVQAKRGSSLVHRISQSHVHCTLASQYSQHFVTLCGG
ncbi:hypothetical protein KI387_015571 [Taxus chinensis]|uniref:Uncharacterized protein n=1 Tax=Taxus chinensis TaxID=29808 RepID=A0AA38LHG0_TAXCH|nr:hypothetical protein KI387_015571 [Taxus chinensis]